MSKFIRIGDAIINVEQVKFVIYKPLLREREELGENIAFENRSRPCVEVWFGYKNNLTFRDRYIQTVLEFFEGIVEKK